MVILLLFAVLVSSLLPPRLLKRLDVQVPQNSPPALLLNGHQEKDVGYVGLIWHSRQKVPTPSLTTLHSLRSCPAGIPIMTPVSEMFLAQWNPSVCAVWNLQHRKEAKQLVTARDLFPLNCSGFFLGHSIYSEEALYRILIIQDERESKGNVRQQQQL